MHRCRFGPGLLWRRGSDSRKRDAPNVEKRWLHGGALHYRRRLLLRRNHRQRSGRDRCLNGRRRLIRKDERIAWRRPDIGRGEQARAKDVLAIAIEAFDLGGEADRGAEAALDLASGLAAKEFGDNDTAERRRARAAEFAGDTEADDLAIGGDLLGAHLAAQHRLTVKAHLTSPNRTGQLRAGEHVEEIDLHIRGHGSPSLEDEAMALDRSFEGAIQANGPRLADDVAGICIQGLSKHLDSILPLLKEPY
ncbi:hypothetical protein BOSEA1005_30262 [Hyphomicrobiales bacterium]|nr:hypothetical protein BOSEA1005_30262 [Hyphomicrobiales bacterium]